MLLNCVVLNCFALCLIPQKFCKILQLNFYQWSSLDCSIWHSFSRFSTVEHITTIFSFLLWCHSCSKKVPVEKESSLSMGGGTANWTPKGEGDLNLKLSSKSSVFSFISFFKRLCSHKKAWYGRNMVDHMKMSQKNARYYSRDY